MVRYSVIVPVYNRPVEVGELLESLAGQSYRDFEVVLVEDGSTMPCEETAQRFGDRLKIRYFAKANSGRSETRNYGMERAEGRYFVFFDSDCILPAEYFEVLTEALSEKAADCHGGPDRAHPSFTALQKAISYAMTSFLTTGGIRGGKRGLERFKPRTFNMGFSREVYESVGGFRGAFGEDIDMSTRIEKAGLRIRLVPEAFVYHKRRLSWRSFFWQVYVFGLTRVELNRLHPGSLKIVHLLPVCFVAGVLVMTVGAIVWSVWSVSPLCVYGLALCVDGWRVSGSLQVALLSVVAGFIQLGGYGAGFLCGFIRSFLLGQSVDAEKEYGKRYEKRK